MKLIDSFLLSFLFVFASIGFLIVTLVTAAVELPKKQSVSAKEPVICQCQCIDKE